MVLKVNHHSLYSFLIDIVLKVTVGKLYINKVCVAVCGSRAENVTNYQAIVRNVDFQLFFLRSKITTFIIFCPKQN